MQPEKTYVLHSSSTPIQTNIDYAKELNDEQLAVVLGGDGPCLVLAGAGSGKTRTLVYRVAHLLEKGIKPEEILLMTFTNKAAREMMERVEQLLGRQPKGLWGGTFHSIANRLLQQYADRVGYGKNFSILDSDDQQKLMTQVHKELAIPKESYIPKKRVIQSIISFAQNSQKSIREVVESSYAYLIPEVIPIIERIAEHYQQKKQEANVMDFDDLLTNLLRLLEHPEAGPRVAQKFTYVLVDEFQDTNTVQAKIVQRFSQPQENILVVGDDAQSIYSFRAATVQNILSFQQVYPQAKLFKLEVNYRSTPDILQLANASIRNNQFQYDKSLRSMFEGQSAKPVLVPSRDAQQQAEFIAQRILELRDKNYSLDEMAVLFRSSFQIIEMELELNKRGIPYIVRGGLRFFEQAHIKDVLAYLQLMHNPRDEMSWRRILGLYEGVGPATATKVWNKLKEQETLTAMLSVLAESAGRGKAAGSIAALQRFFFKLIELPKDRLHELIMTILEQGYQVQLERTYEDARDRLEDLHQLALFAAQYQNLADFLSEASLSEGFKGERAASAQEAEPDERLVLSTIHQAKGLEWDVVFTLGLAEGQFPHYKVADKPQEIEEERRLFYVAVTRPRKLLYMVYPLTSRSYATGEVIHRPSIFIREISDDLFETWQISEVRDHAVISLRNDSGVTYIDEETPADQESGGDIFSLLRNI